MKHGTLSHHCCCGKKIYTRHIVTLDDEGRMLSIEPFSQETANTIFCDDFLMITDAEFEKDAAQFLSSLQQACANDRNTPIGNLIIGNEHYGNHMAQAGKPCHIYAISSIDKATLLPIDIEKIALRKL